MFFFHIFDAAVSVNCPAGKFQADEQSTMCTQCDVGMYSDPGALACNKCDPGQYQDSLGKGSCIECPAGEVRRAARTRMLTLASVQAMMGNEVDTAGRRGRDFPHRGSAVYIGRVVCSS